MESQNSLKHRGILFERLVLGLLKAEAESTNKTLLTGIEAGASYRFVDAIAPEGFLDLPGPCLIEIKLSARIDMLQRTIDRMRRGDIRWESILLVIDEPHSRLEKTTSSLKKHFPDLILKIIGREAISSLKEKHPEVALVYDEQLFDKAITAFGTRETKKTPAQYLNSLRSAFQKDQLVLFLGAGVSLASGMPSWNELLNRLTNSLVQDHPTIGTTKANEKEIVDYFKSEIPDSPLITARILRDSLGDKFPDYVRKALYEQYNPDNSSEIVREIGGLCVPGRSRQGLVSLVNYNFDEIIERELDKRIVSYLVVISEEDTPSPNELPVYHPHGFLPHKGSLASKHRSSLVLSEDSYHSQFIDPFSWPNITQLNLLRNNVCLFVGLSMTDPNLRRLLEISQKKRPGQRHYVILKDHWSPSNKSKKSITLTLANVFRGLEEASFAKLGISVIWVDDHKGVPSILRSIRS